MGSNGNGRVRPHDCNQVRHSLGVTRRGHWHRLRPGWQPVADFTVYLHAKAGESCPEQKRASEMGKRVCPCPLRAHCRRWALPAAGEEPVA